MSEQLTGEQWQERLPDPKIIDPDGWRQDNCNWSTDMMGLEEYLQRLAVCTISFQQSAMENDPCKSS